MITPPTVILISAVLLGLIQTGCTSTRTLVAANTEKPWARTGREQIRREFEGKEVSLRLKSGSDQEGHLSYLRADSIQIESPEPQHILTTFALQDVDILEGKDRSTGMVEGLLIGGGIGLGAGLLITSTFDHSSDDLRGFGEGVTVAGTTVLCATGGLILGAVLAHREQILIVTDSLATVEKPTPQGVIGKTP